MKLAYSNWHKELVHDDGIRAELNIITDGKLEFDSTPFVKHYRTVEGRDVRSGNNYGDNRFKRNNSSNAGGPFQRNTRDGGGSRNAGLGNTRDNRNAGNNPGNNPGGNRDNRDNRNNKFGGKKNRFL